MSLRCALQVKLVRPVELSDKYVSNPMPIPVAEPILPAACSGAPAAAAPHADSISSGMGDLSIATVVDVGSAPGGVDGNAALPMASVVDEDVASQLPPPPSFDVAQDAGLSQLMGIFPNVKRDDAADALQRGNGSVQAAIELLLSEGHGQ